MGAGVLRLESLQHEGDVGMRCVGGLGEERLCGRGWLVDGWGLLDVLHLIDHCHDAAEVGWWGLWFWH